MKKWRVFCALSLILVSIVSMALAAPGHSDSVEPKANTAFSSTEVALSSSMYADFFALTTKSYSKITVSVTLQRKEGSSWVYDRSLPAPVFPSSNTNTWAVSKDYSSYGTSGKTYRIKAVFNAEGVTATAYSVSRTK